MAGGPSSKGGPEQWAEGTPEEKLQTLFFNITIYPSRVAVSFRELPPGESRSSTRWIRTIDRPPGHSNAEALEAALYRIAEAGSSGSLGFSGQDDVT
jgi:hypothetical protein